ncbi:hypothetical protein HA466_0107650 [Hirschfeldia incana]|nr:hypothetical protein HA466_0107650 [Hirschfeldia incana]
MAAKDLNITGILDLTLRARLLGYDGIGDPQALQHQERLRKKLYFAKGECMCLQVTFAHWWFRIVLLDISFLFSFGLKIVICQQILTSSVDFFYHKVWVFVLSSDL